MSGFSPEWLALREPVDHRSRDPGVAARLRAHFADRQSLSVIDLGCGTGSNVRGTFHLLPAAQQWTLVDYDPGLLAAARDAIAHWADTWEPTADGLVARKDGQTLRIEFCRADLNADLEGVLGGAATDLVTASAFFDLCSAAFIARFAAAVARAKAAFLTVLTYNGGQEWSPAHAADTRLLAAFHAHQAGDKGFGPAAGPAAPAALQSAFLAAGYGVVEGDSPWRMGASDLCLIGDLAAGFAAAAAETGAVDGATLAAWSAVVRTNAVVGHTDTLALPGQE
jgi:SAM-dependent methyltransferase